MKVYQLLERLARQSPDAEVQAYCADQEAFAPVTGLLTRVRGGKSVVELHTMDE